MFPHSFDFCSWRSDRSKNSSFQQITHCLEKVKTSEDIHNIEERSDTEKSTKVIVMELYKTFGGVLPRFYHHKYCTNVYIPDKHFRKCYCHLCSKIISMNCWRVDFNKYSNSLRLCLFIGT